jgi:hypothetical protein
MQIPLKMHEFSGWNVVVHAFQIISAVAVVAALVYAAKTYQKGKKLEQIKLANDILKDLRQQESKLPQISKETNVAQREIAMSQWISDYFDIWEWYSFLVNHKDVEHEGLKDYFKTSIIRAHDEILKTYGNDEEKQDDTIYKEFKNLYKELTKS